jgi:hypothetical protein
MSASEVKINCSRDRRRELRILKAKEEFADYDDALGALIDEYDASIK